MYNISGVESSGKEAEFPPVRAINKHRLVTHKVSYSFGDVCQLLVENTSRGMAVIQGATWREELESKTIPLPRSPLSTCAFVVLDIFSLDTVSEWEHHVYPSIIRRNSNSNNTVILKKIWPCRPKNEPDRKTFPKRGRCRRKINVPQLWIRVETCTD